MKRRSEKLSNDVRMFYKQRLEIAEESLILSCFCLRHLSYWPTLCLGAQSGW